MPDPAAESTLAQIREVAAWWHGDANATEAQAAGGRPWYTQAAATSRRQRDDWHALGDLLYAVTYPRNQLGVEHLTKAAERLADRLDPDWRRVRTEASSDG